MFYEFLKIVMQIVFPFWYRKVYLIDQEKVPHDKPVILACNHPNAFLDAIVVSTYFKKRQIHYLVRSDVFNTPFKRWILGQMNQIPIYRIEEGYNNLKKNKATFTACITLMGQNKVLLVFSEGNCVQEKRLRRLRKGTARIALEAETAFNHSPDIQVVPVGINYTSPSSAGDEVIIKFGDAIPVKNYVEDYENHPATAFKKFNPELSKAMKEQLIIIPEKKDEVVSEAVMKIGRNDIYSRNKKERGSKLFVEQKKQAAAISKLPEEKKKKLEELVSTYTISLRKKGLMDADLIRNHNSKWPFSILLVLLFPFYLSGIVLNGLPHLLANKFTDKNIKALEFYASVKFGLNLVLYLIYYLLIFFLTLSFGNIYWALLTPAFPLLGIIALAYHKTLLKVINSFKYDSLESSFKKELHLKREEIKKMVL